MSEWHAIDEFDPSWSWLFKWGYSAQHDRAHAWRIRDDEGDGSVTHRQEFEQTFGHPAKTLQGDQLGVASYIPEERKIDGTLVAPPEIQIHTYYGQKPHDRVYEWFLNHYPDVVTRQAQVFNHKTHVASPQPIRWTWSPEEGLQLGKTLPGPKSFTGYVEVGPKGLRIIADRPEMPGHGLAAVKEEMAKQFPDSRIELPDAPDAQGLKPGYLDRQENGEVRRLAAVHWANDMFIDGEPVKSELIFPELEVPQEKKSFWDRFRRKTAEADMEGAMVGVWIPERVAEKIKVKGGEPPEMMHITLAYFVDKAADRDDWDEVKKLVETIANQTAPMVGKVGGVGIFNGKDGDVLWASPSVPGLVELRQKIVEACEDAGFKVSDEHGWVPHITLKYNTKGVSLKRFLQEDIELPIDNISFAQGDKHEDFELKGHFEKETSWEMTEWKWPGTQRFVTDGKDILLEPEDKGEWVGADLEPLHERFQSFYPDSKKVPASGWVIPTADDMGYGIWAPKVGYGGPEELGLHELVNRLDRELKKPTHLVEDWGQITDPKMYVSTHPD